LFFSADTEWVDYLQARSLTDASTRQNVLGNKLVLIAGADSKINLTIAPNFPWLRPSVEAVSPPATRIPCPSVVMRAVRSRRSVCGTILRIEWFRADNVRVALAYVARGEAALGIVYETDALIEKKVRVVDTFPADTHLPITYPHRIDAYCFSGRQELRRFCCRTASSGDLQEVRLHHQIKTGIL